MNLARLPLAVSAALVLTCTACASREPPPPPLLHHPLGNSTLAWLEPFDIENTVFIGDHFSHTKEVVRDRLTATLADRLRQAGFKVTIAEQAAPDSKEGLVVRGTLDLVNAGDRRTRAMWGPSAGLPEFRCTALVYNLAVSATDPAATVTVSGNEDDQDWINKAIYPSFGDAAAASRKIVKFITENRK